MSFRIIVLPSDKKIKVPKKTLLSDALREAGLSPALYCRGRGVCGKCFVEILEGELPVFKPGEEELLERAGLSLTHRLACQFIVESDLRLRIPEAALPGRVAVAESGPEFSLPLDPAVKKFSVRLPKPEISGAEAELDILFRELKVDSLSVSPDVLKKWTEVLTRSDRRLTAVVGGDEELLDIESGDTSGRLLGLAFDIGTTTLASALVDLAAGRVLARDSCLNSQTAYGADVVSRIDFALEQPGRSEILRRTVLSDLAGLTRNLLSSSGRDAASIYAVSVAGNTAMNHLLLGLPVETLALAPFNPVFSRLPALPSSVLGLDIHPRASVYIAPNIRSFIGGDISAGLAVSGFLRDKGPALYLDLGTNGEVVLKNGRRLWATSTAAGPAFEGMNISCGMLARPGAVFKVEPDGEGLRCRTIEDAPPRGVCGTGLIDAAALFLERGLISPRGRVLAPGGTLTLTRGLNLTQKDIRELQLVVGAVKTGMRMMLRAHDLQARDLAAIFIAGAFGSTLSLSSSMKLGLLPDVDPSKIRFLGNASLAGAEAFLLSVPARRSAEITAREVEHFSLASQPSFQDTYLSSLELGMWR